MHAKLLQSCSILCDPMDIAHWVPLSMQFARQECWSGLPCPPPGHLPHPGIEPASLRSPELASEFFITSATWETQAPTVGTNTPPALEEGGEVFMGGLRSNQVLLLQKVFYQQITG